MDLAKITSGRHDDDFFYLEHAERGPFQIAKRGLSPALRRQVEEFCKGGEVKGYSGENAAQDPGTQVVTPPGEGFRIDPATGETVYVPAPEAGRGIPPPPVDTGFQDTSSSFDAPIDALKHIGSTAGDAIDAISNKLRSLSGEVAISGEAPPAATPTVQPQGSNYVDALLGRPQGAPAPASALDQTQAALSAGRAALSGGAAGAPASEPPPATPNAMEPILKQLQTVLSGRGLSGVPAVNGKIDLSEYDKGVKQVQDAQDAMRQIQADHSREDFHNAVTAQQLVNGVSQDYTKRIRQAQDDADRSFQEYLNTPFDPNRIFHSADVGSKVLGAIGIMLGGIGSGIRGEAGNPVMDLIHRAIDRDVEAQKVDLGKKQSAVSYYVNKGIQLQQAMQLAKSDAQDKVAAMMAVTAARYGQSEKSAQLQIEAGKYRAEAFKGRQDAWAQAVHNAYQPALIQSQLATQAMERKTREVELLEKRMGLARQQMIMDQIKADGGRDPWIMERMRLAMEPKAAGEQQITAIRNVPTGAVDKDGNAITQPVTVRRFATSPAVQPEASKRLVNLTNFDERANYVKDWIARHPSGKLFPGEDASAIEGAVKELGLSWGPAAEGVPSLNEPEMEEVRHILGNPASWWEQVKNGRSAVLAKQLDRVSNMAHGSLETFLIPTRESLGLH